MVLSRFVWDLKAPSAEGHLQNVAVVAFRIGVILVDMLFTRREPGQHCSCVQVPFLRILLLYHLGAPQKVLSQSLCWCEMRCFIDCCVHWISSLSSSASFFHVLPFLMVLTSLLMSCAYVYCLYSSVGNGKKPNTAATCTSSFVHSYCSDQAGLRALVVKAGDIEKCLLTEF